MMHALSYPSLIFPHLPCFQTKNAGSYFLRVRSKLLHHSSFWQWLFRRSRACSTFANQSLRLCDLKICVAFTFAGSMNQTWGWYILQVKSKRFSVLLKWNGDGVVLLDWLKCWSNNSNRSPLHWICTGLTGSTWSTDIFLYEAFILTKMVTL